MKISLATNFDDDLITQISGYPVYEIYGKLKTDIFGGGRPSNTLDDLSRAKLESHVRLARRNNIKFNYLLNSACFNNREMDKKWQDEAISFLNYLRDIGVNALTVSNQLLLKLVKKYFDCFSVRISIFSCVSDYARARQWEEMGADFICADIYSLNRNFKEIEKIVKNLKTAKLELLANVSCLKACPYAMSHANSIAHASNSYEPNEKSVDYCILHCQRDELLNPIEYIRSCWIRPEDIKCYERIGVEHFKLTERGIPTRELVKRVKAYSEGHYDGNLIDLVLGHGFEDPLDDNSAQISYRTNSELNSVSDIADEIFKIRGMGRARKVPSHIYIDNKKLDGFIDYFIEGKCSGLCDKCTYCKNYYEKSVVLNEEVRSKLLALYRKFDEILI
ncbi:MAG: U32 family peptidase [Rickettsiales bacterium]|jgi:collagenase-like PrtC family protease|nr:U32 family peptidase [Rickettsiales bacterium]